VRIKGYYTGIKVYINQKGGVKTPRNIRVSLDWDGPYTDPESVPSQRAGIYMVIAGRQDEDGNLLTRLYRPLDIGQSGESGVRLRGHDREPCWNQNKPSGYILVYKFAAMPSADYDETDRRIVECCLRASHRPLPCGVECNQEYNRDDSVVITNTGSYSPLNESYFCSPQ